MGGLKLLQHYFKQGADGHVRVRGLFLEHWAKAINTSIVWMSIRIGRNAAGSLWSRGTLISEVQHLAPRRETRATHTRSEENGRVFREAMCTVPCVQI